MSVLDKLTSSLLAGQSFPRKLTCMLLLTKGTQSSPSHCLFWPVLSPVATDVLLTAFKRAIVKKGVHNLCYTTLAAVSSHAQDHRIDKGGRDRWKSSSPNQVITTTREPSLLVLKSFFSWNSVMQYKVTTFRTVMAILNLASSLLSITVCSTQ